MSPPIPPPTIPARLILLASGALARRTGILLTPEEARIPVIVARSGQLADAIRNELPAQAWRAALTEETAIAIHQAFLAYGPSSLTEIAPQQHRQRRSTRKPRLRSVT
ncbi:hypothetical protein AB0H00_27535 [Nocardia sp. NPDC023852]|uniref:hypothetical protein n=1 Tax=Nocardia sp. NPDC023852 TaxID=3154697 RepID=UPI0033ED8E4F